MNYIRILPVNGLFHELYKPEPNGLSTFKVDIKNNELDAVNLFWSLIFDIHNIKQIVDKIVPYSPKYKAIVSNKELFIKQVKIAKECICSIKTTPKDFFRDLETLSIVCSLYSEYVFYPHRITLQNGFEIDNSSASQIYNECLSSEKNPYLEFVIHYIMPQIRISLPQVIFIDGMPTFYNMAICQLVKKEFPEIHICLSRHSSEYYSINKLGTRLIQNEFLFKMIDSIVLEYFDETEKQLLNALKNNETISDVSNLIYKSDNKIYATSNKMLTNKCTPYTENQYPSSELVNVHLQPYNMCYWNKCTFCGINKKYHFNNNIVPQNALDISLNKLKRQIDTHINYIWFIDEAIHPIKLKCIAKYFIDNNIKVFWQVRCRIEQSLLDEELIMLLQKSGLKELRLGLESASIDVLKTMNKFDETFSLELVESICVSYSAVGIYIHFPIIIGFPTETTFERKKTYDYLQYLCKKYPFVSFNINVFNLDISSEVFNHPYKYRIEKIYYPCPLHDFLGNTLQWKRDDMIQENLLFIERDQYMREILYPWMPANTYIKPHIFYRFCETIRNTLIWKCQESYDTLRTEKKLPQFEPKVMVPDTLVYSFDSNRNVYIIYDWQTHHYMIGNENLIFILDFFKEAYSIPDAIERLVTYNSAIYSPDDLNILLPKLYQKGYLIESR